MSYFYRALCPNSIMSDKRIYLYFFQNIGVMVPTYYVSYKPDSYQKGGCQYYTLNLFHCYLKIKEVDFTADLHNHKIITTKLTMKTLFPE